MIEPSLLIDNLNRIGVHFLVGERISHPTPPLSPGEILAGLAMQPDARLRLALIAVLLQRPVFAKNAHQALMLMDETQGLIFKLYYTAAYYLQISFRDQLQELIYPYDALPDLYSADLKIEKNLTAKDQLRRIAELHKEISGLHLNWYGTYHSAAQRVITRLQKERVWATA